MSNKARLSDDPAVRYAERVASGDIVAGLWVKLAAERMLADFGQPHLTWDRDAARRYYDFCADVCVVDDQINGGLMPFELLDWQKFAGGNAFGWRIKDSKLDPLERLTGTRRYRTLYIETGKGSGKSPFGSSFMLYFLIADGESEPEIYIAAKAEHQALIPWRALRKMVMANDALSPKAEPPGLLEVFGGAKEGRITYPENNGFVMTVAHHADGAGVSGPKPSFVLIEEYHEHQTDLMREMLDDGKKGRKQPLTMIITNAGGAQVGPCWDEHVKATQVLRGVAKADDYLPLIYSIDKDDQENWMEDRSCWPKANPSLGDGDDAVIRPDYILGQISKARGAKSKLRRIERFNMAVWPDAGGDWMEWDQWMRVEADRLDEAILDECKLFMTCDLADRRDLTALTYNWLHPSGHLYQRTRYFTPADTLPDRARTTNSYLEDWASHGPDGKDAAPGEAFIETCPGSVLDYKIPARRMIEANERWGIVCVGFDAYHWGQFCVALQDLDQPWYNLHPNPDSPYRADRQWKQPGAQDGLAMVDHPQGFIRGRRGQKVGLHMSESIDLWEARILAEEPTVTIEANPVLRWNVTCGVVVWNAQGARKFDKGRAQKRYNGGKIDGLISGAMGAGLVDFEFPLPTGLAGLYSSDKPWTEGWFGNT